MDFLIVPCTTKGSIILDIECKSLLFQINAMSSTSNEPPSKHVGERDGTKAEKESLTDWYVDGTTTVSLSVDFSSVHCV
jgi:hypothetical protein